MLTCRQGLLLTAGLALMGMALLASPDRAEAGIRGARVIRGNVVIEHDGGHTVIDTSSRNAILEFQRFNIAAGESVRFIQPDASSRVLNRITGGDLTRIAGQLQANGIVYIVNPAGIHFAQGAQVDVAGLFAAAGNISDEHFLAGIDHFQGLDGHVTQAGQINADQFVHLLGQHVTNLGTIRAPQGAVTMLAGNDIYLSESEHGRVLVRVDGRDLDPAAGPAAGQTSPDLDAQAGVDQAGTIEAAGGRVTLGAGDFYSLAVRHSGTTQASGGDVEVLAADGAIHQTGTIDVSSLADAGRITVQGPSVVHAGSLIASSAAGQGGDVEVTSNDHTFLLPGSLIDVSGDHGGNVLVHSYDGATQFRSGAAIDASGAQTGGHVEVSAHGHLLFHGDVRLGGALARGSLLLDPLDLTVVAEGDDDDLLDEGEANSVNFEQNAGENSTISAWRLEAIDGDITLEAQRDLTIDAEVNLVNDNVVTLRAGHDLIFNQKINGADVIIGVAHFEDYRHMSEDFGRVIFNIDGLSANQVMQFQGAQIVLTQDIVFNGGGALQLNGPVVTENGTHALTILGAAQLLGPIGTDENPLASLQLGDENNTGGEAVLGGGAVHTVGDQTYHRRVILDQDTMLASSDGTIHLIRDVEAGSEGAALEVIAPMLVLEGNVGGSHALDSFVANADVLATGGGATSIHTEGRQDFVGTLTVADATELTLVADNAEQWSDDLAQIPGTESLQGVVVLWEAIDGPGTLNVQGETGAGFQSTIQGLAALNVTGEGDAFFVGTIDDVGTLDVVVDGDALFQSAVNGGGAMTVDAGGWIDILADFGVETALGSLSLTAREGMVLPLSQTEGEMLVLRTVGDLELNPAGRDDVPPAATIGAFDLKLVSTEGNIIMGQNEKLSVLGDFAAEAGQDVVLGDVNTLGDMVVDAGGAIWILTRDAGMVLLANGNEVMDDGVDFVAGGQFLFNMTPQLMGEGPAPAFASGHADPDPMGTLGFPVRRINPLTENNFMGQTVPLLDLHAQRAEWQEPTPPTPPTPDEEGGGSLAIALAVDGPDASEQRRRVIAQSWLPSDVLDALAELNINVREINPARPREDAIIDDYALVGLGASDGLAISSPRLRAAALARLLDAYRETMTRRVLDTDTGQWQQEPRIDAIRNALAAAWSDYTDAYGDDPSPTGLREHLAGQAEHRLALAYMDALATVLRQADHLGLNNREAAYLRQALVQPIAPAGMDAADVEAAILGSGPAPTRDARDRRPGNALGLRTR